MKKNIFKSNGFQSLLASLLCIVLGLFLGYLVLLVINPAGAGEAILTVVKNFLTYKKTSSQLKYLGNTLVKTAPLLMCSLSILFAYKVGLFNIGAAGRYCFGVALSLYAALGLGWSWLPCLLVAMAGGAVLGAISGVLKSYSNVNEVISGIMLNWIVLYLTNMLLTTVKEAASPYTIVLANNNPSTVLPSLGLGALFNKNQYVGLRQGGKAEREPEPGDLWCAGRHGCGAAVPHRLRAVAVLYLLRSRHGLQRHCRRLLRGTESSGDGAGVLLHPAHHRWRRVCG